MLNIKGYTLTEIIVVVVIIGAMTALAVPRFTTVIEKTRSSEAVQMLEALRKAQITYFHENNTYTNNIAGLDIDVPTMDNFDAPTFTTNAATIASIQRSTNAYTLEMAANGEIACDGAICGKLGL